MNKRVGSQVAYTLSCDLRPVWIDTVFGVACAADPQHGPSIPYLFPEICLFRRLLAHLTALQGRIHQPMRREQADIALVKPLDLRVGKHFLAHNLLLRTSR